jgi:hypothetical protein
MCMQSSVLQTIRLMHVTGFCCNRLLQQHTVMLRHLFFFRPENSYSSDLFFSLIITHYLFGK